jgi:hypothetical protein
MGTYTDLPNVPTRPFSLECTLLYNTIFHLDRGEPELALQRLGAKVVASLRY